MADTETRQDVVEANIEAVIDKYGPEATERINTQCLQDISVSLAMLVDAGASSGT
jgi:hypothetical protein